jgi:predicted RNA binding protein YcfA (HicA-like mRNA interferase family)
MFTPRDLSYGHLAKVLEKLGYQSKGIPGSHVVFSYRGKPSVLLPWRRANNKVDETRLAGVFQLVSAGGVASRRELEQLLIEPPRRKRAKATVNGTPRTASAG